MRGSKFDELFVMDEAHEVRNPFGLRDIVGNDDDGNGFFELEK